MQNPQLHILSNGLRGVLVPCEAESVAFGLFIASGSRHETANAEGTERHVYDNNWQVIADTDENGNVLRSYVWGEGIDKLLSVKIGNHTYTALTDVQGTVWGYADEGGNVVARWTYDAWGNMHSGDISLTAFKLRTVRHRFQGREHSVATGLTNFRMRWYDVVTGRWLSKDPVRIVGGLNQYLFCHGSPLVCQDSWGLDPEDGNSGFSVGMATAGVAEELLPDAVFDALGKGAASTAVGQAKLAGNVLSGVPNITTVLKQIDAMHEIQGQLEVPGSIGTGVSLDSIPKAESDFHKASAASEKQGQDSVPWWLKFFK